MAFKFRLLTVILFAILLAIYPREALLASLEAMSVWAFSFAPSLFPFFAILPALSCPEALRLYDKLFGKILPRLFGCPAGAAAAICIGWIAGSPAGSIAIRRVAQAGGITRAQVRRMAALTCGVSPMFLISAVGAGLLASPQHGALLMRSQFLALLFSGLILRRAWQDDDAEAVPPEQATQAERPSPMREAVLQMLTVCGWMVLFAVIARLISAALSLSFIEPPLLAILEVAGGCAALSQISIPFAPRLVLLGAVCCFGGLCIMTQNMQQLKTYGVKWRHMAAIKGLHALFGALFTYLQLKFLPVHAAAVFSYRVETLSVSVGVAAALGLAVSTGALIYRRRNAGT